MAVRRQPIPFGKYFLLDRINIGGMAEVWRAKTFGEQGFEKLVAIKRILPNIAEDDEFITMFIDEAKITVQLTHANVAQVFDLGKIGDSYFIAMEYVAGKDLRAIFDRCRKRNEPAPIPMVCFMCAKMCEGLDYAHRKKDTSGRDLNIVHRDVSPQNCLVSFEGEIKVIDFGIAKAANKATKTQAGILKGKFGYMSPEQVRGLPLDQRSDVFAAGVVLYEMLTGERLFVGDSDFSVLEKVRQVDILPPTKYNRRIPEGLEKIVLKALTKDPDERYAWASDLADALQRFLITNDNIFSRKDLAQYMKSTFAEDVEKEKVRQAEYAEIKLPAGALAGGPVSSPPSPSSRPTAPMPARPSAPGNPPALRPAPPASLPQLAAAASMQETAPEVAEHTVIDGKDVYADSAPRAPSRAPAAPQTIDLDEAIEEQLMSEPPSGNGASALAPERPIGPGRVSVNLTPPGGAPRITASRPLPPGLGQPARQVPGAPPLRPISAPGSQPQGFRPRMPELDKVADGAPRSKGRLVLIGVLLALVVGVAFAGVIFKYSTGALVVDYDPADARVYVDGAEVCVKSPCYAAKVPWGKRLVEIRKDRYVPYSTSVDIPRGDAYNLGPHVTLKPLVVKIAVVISSDQPDAEVKIDGKVVRSAGKGPPYSGDLVVGKHKIEVSKPGFTPWTKEALEISDTDKPPVSLFAELVVQKLVLNFVTTPPGAKVVVDDKPRGETPVTIDDLDPGTAHSVVFQKAGFKDATATVMPGAPSGEIAKTLEKK